MTNKKITVLCCTSTLAAVVIRLLQLLFFIDTETGFSKTDSLSGTMLIVGYILIALCIASVLVFSTFFNQSQPTKSPVESKPLGIMAFVMCIYNIYSLAATTIAGLQGMATVKMILLLLNIIFFLLYGISHFTATKAAPMLSLAPVITSLYITVEQFLSYNGVANISENVFNIFYMCLQTLFFLHHSKIICSTEMRRSCRLVLPVANLSFALAAICTVPQLLLYATIGSEALHSSGATSFGALFTGIYALCFATELYKTK